MSIRICKVPTVTAVGSAGSATGTQTASIPVSGELKAIKVVQGNTPHANTDITISISEGGVTQTLLTITNSSTASKWYYPAALAQGVDAADLTAIYAQLPLFGYVTVTVAQGGSNATCDVAVVYEE